MNTNKQAGYFVQIFKQFSSDVLPDSSLENSGISIDAPTNNLKGNFSYLQSENKKQTSLIKN